MKEAKPVGFPLVGALYSAWRIGVGVGGQGKTVKKAVTRVGTHPARSWKPLNPNSLSEHGIYSRHGAFAEEVFFGG